MTGLEAILAQIEQEAQAQAQELLAQARDEAQAALDAARQEAQAQAEEILEGARKRAQAQRQRAKSSAALEKRDRLLRCKQGLIREALEQACSALENAPAEEYFPLLIELAGRAALPGDGVLYLNRRDLERLPEDFQQRLDKAAPGGKITLAREPRKLEGGFVLAYGPVEMDCSFAALFQEAGDRLRDQVGAILFAPAGEEKEEP